MGFNDFFEREDVYGIIKNTLFDNYGADVMFTKNRSKIEQVNENYLFYSFPKLNIIFSKTTNRTLLIKFLFCNLLGNQNVYKRILSKIYIYLSIYFPQHFSSMYMVVMNNVDIQGVIYPGNKRLKIIDFESGVLTNILKSGFGKNWFENEINFRTNTDYNFVNPITPISNVRFEEELLNGKPLARFSSVGQKKYTVQVNSILTQINKNAHSNKVTDYVNDISDTIIYELDLLNDQLIVVRQIVLFIKEYFKKKEYYINIVSSHGDFQKGNIMINKDDTIKVLDWETYGVREEHYDYMIFNYNLRNSNKIVENLKKVMSLKNHKLPHFHFQINQVDLVLLFLIEDIKWQLEETKELPNNIVSFGLMHFNNNVILLALMEMVKSEKIN
jgi:hypothetical protein